MKSRAFHRWFIEQCEERWVPSRFDSVDLPTSANTEGAAITRDLDHSDQQMSDSEERHSESVSWQNHDDSENGDRGSQPVNSQTHSQECWSNDSISSEQVNVAGTNRSDGWGQSSRDWGDETNDFGRPTPIRDHTGDSGDHSLVSLSVVPPKVKVVPSSNPTYVPSQPTYQGSSSELDNTPQIIVVISTYSTPPSQAAEVKTDSQTNQHSTTSQESQSTQPVSNAADALSRSSFSEPKPVESSVHVSVLDKTATISSTSSGSVPVSVASNVLASIPSLSGMPASGGQTFAVSTTIANPISPEAFVASGKNTEHSASGVTDFPAEEDLDAKTTDFERSSEPDQRSSISQVAETVAWGTLLGTPLTGAIISDVVDIEQGLGDLFAKSQDSTSDSSSPTETSLWLTGAGLLVGGVALGFSNRSVRRSLNFGSGPTSVIARWEERHASF